MTALHSLSRLLRQIVIWLVLVVGVLWAFGALWFDFPVLKVPAALLFLLLVAAACVFLRPVWRSQTFIAVVVLLIAAWWFTLRPSNDRPWQPDVAETAWAERDGDQITFHNVRNCEYRTATDFTPRWETRTVRLSQITALDLAINYWGSPWMAHPIACFQFADAPPLCFSIETRREVGESYSAIGGLYRQYELIYIVADERDALGVRTNVRSEDIYLYRLNLPLSRVRELFLYYVNALNAIHTTPRWYNAITTNCTTAIRTQNPVNDRMPWDWRLLVNGKGDEMLYERNLFVTGGLPFAELKQRSLIDDRARAAGLGPDFSVRIRQGLLGMPP